MNVHVTESVWLNASDVCSFEQLVEVSGLTQDDLLNLVETGIIEPANRDPDHYVFQSQCLVVARKARRLRDDFELDAHGLALALSLLDRIDHLQAQLNNLHARLPQGKA
jgi:chaperone modulatory protein CbpM